ncbi:SIT4-associating protein [Blastomyces parvus]|uniref:SIT4-associating protein n=1 Tax=Blastomyces parvus TaxID=2060905 RepID=A0A2B7WZQ6_9EURO|nr:SIT4-associating protein [Blastomyces parvus]
MFWRFGGYANISAIDTLLEKADVSLEEVLDESELMQELKQHNTKLIEYLRDDNVLKRLLDYVISPSLIDDEDDHDDDANEEKEKDREGETTEGQEAVVAAEKAKERDQEEADDDPTRLSSGLDNEDLENAEKSRLKYSYIACEILSSNSWSIIESMMLNEGYLRDFWRFLWREAPLDPLQSGYFTKVNEVLLEKKTEEMLAFIKSLDGVVSTLLRHVDNPMIMDLLLKIISLERMEGGQGVVEWLQSQDLIPSLLSCLSTEHTSSTQTSAGDFLKAIITISANAAQNDQSCIGPNSLTRQLVSEPCVEVLISSMLKGGNPLTVGVGIVIEVIRKNNSDYDPENTGGPDSPPTIHDPIYLGVLLRMFAKNVPGFMNLILSSKHTVNEGGQHKVVERPRLDSAWGTSIEPLGFDRFKTCELMAELLHCSNMGLLNEIGSDEYIRKRDAERERLRAQGAFAHGEDDSGFEYADNTNEFANGISPSALGSGSPEDIKRLDASQAGEEDGFEDVASSGVLIDDVKDDFDEKAEGENNAKAGPEPFTSIPPHAPKLGISDDFVDEPLTPPEQGTTLDAKVIQPLSPSQINDPLSPTASNLTQKVESFKIDAEQQHSPNEKHAPLLPTEVPTNDLPEGQCLEKQGGSQGDHEPDSLLSPHPEDTPAPLFAAKDTSAAVDTQTPGQEGAEGKVETSTSFESSGITSSLTPSITMGDVGENVAHPHIQIDTDGQPVVGDYLKIMFVEHKVIPTILSFFFRFAWNNFLHNVVYDVVQQVFNGPMDRGFNRSLAIDLFESGHITEQIVQGQRRSDEAQRTKNMRLGYMGHLTLIAEEVVKFSERHPPELLSATVMENVLHPDWIDYVERTLSETRERDNAILGGVRPDMSMGHRQAVLNAVNASQGFTASTALANAGLNGGAPGATFEGLDIVNQGSASGGAFFGGTGGPSLLSGFGSSSDDEDEEMEDPEDEDGGARKGPSTSAESGPDNESSHATSQPIPMLSPPAPLNIPPSRARLQLAARLAAQKERAEAAISSAPSGDISKHAEAPSSGDSGQSMNYGYGLSSVLDPFGLPAQRNEGFDSSGVGNTSSYDPFSSPFATFGGPSSPPSSLSSFPQVHSYSSNSSDDGEELSTEEAVQRKVRLPLEVDDDDADEMGDIIGPNADLVSAYSDDDEEDETLVGEPLAYSNFFEGGRFGSSASGARLRGAGGDILHDPEGRHDSSDGEEDDGLVEILVPGRK